MIESSKTKNNIKNENHKILKLNLISYSHSNIIHFFIYLIIQENIILKIKSIYTNRLH